MEQKNEKMNNKKEELPDKLYKLIDCIMDAIIEDKINKAIELLGEAKKLQKGLQNNNPDIHRINEELKELTNLIKYTNKYGDEQLKKRIKKTKKRKAEESKVDRNQAIVKEIYSLIDQLMDALAIDDRKTAAKLMIKIKKLYTTLDGYIVDKHRIYEEMAELKKILYEREKS